MKGDIGEELERLKSLLIESLEVCEEMLEIPSTKKDDGNLHADYKKAQSLYKTFRHSVNKPITIRKEDLRNPNFIDFLKHLEVLRKDSVSAGQFINYGYTFCEEYREILNQKNLKILVYILKNILGFYSEVEKKRGEANVEIYDYWAKLLNFLVVVRPGLHDSEEKSENVWLQGVSSLLDAFLEIQKKSIFLRELRYAYGDHSNDRCSHDFKELLELSKGVTRKEDNVERIRNLCNKSEDDFLGISREIGEKMDRYYEEFQDLDKKTCTIFVNFISIVLDDMEQRFRKFEKV